MLKRIFFINILILLLGIGGSAQASDVPFNEKLKGYILLQVESVGEAWYVNPVDVKRYYMRDGEAAYNIMRYFGLGASNNDIERILNNDFDVINRLKGRIVLQIEEHGEAYYIHPKDGSVHYLRNGEVAYELMRSLSLGITNYDIARISIGESDLFIDRDNNEMVEVLEEIGSEIIKPVLVEEVEVEFKFDELIVDDVVVAEDYSGEVFELTGGESEKVGGVVDELNEYWLGLVNGIRGEEYLRELVVDDRLIETATEWAEYMSKIDLATHSRWDGSSMHDWIDEKGLEFGMRGTNEGWSRNYFTENVAWNVMSGESVASLMEALNETFYWMLEEKKYNGIHYRTMMHSDWNSVGLGYVVNQLPSGRYQTYIAMHYGNLNME